MKIHNDKFITTPILMHVEYRCPSTFDKLYLSRDLILDFDAQIKSDVIDEFTGDYGFNMWGINFTKAYLKESMIEWLLQKEFEVIIIQENNNLNYFISFTSDKDQFEFAMKFDKFDSQIPVPN